MTPVEGETSTTPRTDTSSNISQSFVSPTTQSTTPFGHLQATPTQPTFMPDFGLSALSSLTQIAKLQSNTPKDYPSTILHPNAFSQTTSLGPTPDTLPQSRVYAVLLVWATLTGKNSVHFFVFDNIMRNIKQYLLKVTFENCQIITHEHPTSVSSCCSFGAILNTGPIFNQSKFGFTWFLVVGGI